MAKQGWVQFHRKIFNSDVWTDEPYTERELWIHLFAMANHKDNYTNWHGERILIRRGQHLTSILKLAEITHHDPKWVERKLKSFVKMGMIIVEKRPNRFTLITVFNYDNYNTVRGEDAITVATTETTTDAIQTTMIKNEKNDKKYNNPEINDLCSLLKSRIIENNPKAVIDTKRWLYYARQMIDRDKRTPDDIRRAIEFSQRDRFWKTVVLSMKNVRNNFDKLMAQYLAKKGRSNESKNARVPGRPEEFSRTGWNEWPE